ncbi:MAG: type II toxin-antitoxin system mRNA interferase toxin, RelE/StbE family [Patescibacteria group bacterium]
MEIRFAKQFKKHYQKSPPAIRQAFDGRLELFMADPNNFSLKNHPLKGDLFGKFTINVTGDWRAVYTVADGVIIFVALGTHSQLYG